MRYAHTGHLGIVVLALPTAASVPIMPIATAQLQIPRDDDPLQEIEAAYFKGDWNGVATSLDPLLAVVRDRCAEVTQCPDVPDSATLLVTFVSTQRSDEGEIVRFPWG